MDVDAASAEPARAQVRPRSKSGSLATLMCVSSQARSAVAAERRPHGLGCWHAASRASGHARAHGPRSVLLRAPQPPSEHQWLVAGRRAVMKRGRSPSRWTGTAGHSKTRSACYALRSALTDIEDVPAHCMPILRQRAFGTAAPLTHCEHPTGLCTRLCPCCASVARAAGDVSALQPPCGTLYVARGSGHAGHIPVTPAIALRCTARPCTPTAAPVLAPGRRRPFKTRTMTN